MKLFGGGKIQEKRKATLAFAQAMGKQPSLAECKQLEAMTKELIDAGYWQAHESLFGLYGKMIWATLDYGQIDLEDASNEKRAEIRSYATLGSMHVGLFLEKSGKISQEQLDNAKAFQQEFKKYYFG